MDSATWAAWAQAVGTVGSTGAALWLIRQERSFRHRDEERRREDLDRETIAELRKVLITFDYVGGSNLETHDIAAVVDARKASVGIRQADVIIRISNEDGSVLDEALEQTVKNVPAGEIIRGDVVRIPWGPVVRDIHWVITAMLIDEAGGRWMVSDLGQVTRLA